MRNALTVHVLQSFKNLKAKETSDVLAHGAHHLAKVEEEATANVFHLNVDEALDEATRRLFHNALVAVALEADDVRAAQVA